MAQRRVPTIDDLRVKLCYICREEERYDAPENPPRAWTHPCRCTLVAHESCLLQWIQSSQQTRSRAPNALKCPQCSSPYVLESNNPIILRLLDAANKGLSAIGKIVTVASFTVVVVSIGTGMYILCTTYGAYALREFLGPEMFDILLSDDPARWPWHSFINLPLIPLSLIMSRLPTKSSITPLVPVLLAWPTSAPIRANNSIILDGWRNPFLRTDPREFLHPLPRWPPPPMILGLFVFPAVRQAYKRMLGNFTRWLLNSNTPHGQDMQRVLNGNDDEPFLRIRVNANVEEDVPIGQANVNGQPPGQQGLDANNDNEANAPAGDAVAAAENTIRVSGTSLGRLIGGALIIPRISSFMGSLLLRLSMHSRILRKILAVRPPLPTGVVPPAIPRSLFNGKAWSEMSLLKRISYVGYLGLTVAWRGTMTWAECDPVWWRNSLGLGVFVMAKDCVHLLHLWLTKRELESRRVKNRSFEDVDVQELDLINPSVYS
ncbi:hypothetical protein F5J12DRAFT_842004 [Pisolithus orientalis]|uniref:uncharacterized protein n=1 Tax=Pisolithus orientalis TaxID=936130 RepID=UPI002223F508|nr:uncharacterized protein F5J12DRAFT_842004 [Pisolithus orientalis]KAI6002259.1 hypothetical protein F5J12DRAFT_842004 [Pisolithus orientalis]